MVLGAASTNSLASFRPRRGGSGNGSGSGYAEFGFQRLNQIHELDNAHALNGIDKFFMSHENDLQ